MNGPEFDGPAYSPEHDKARLTSQLETIRELMADGQWRTLTEIERETGYRSASISAQLRHLRKPRFGAWAVDKQHRGEPKEGLWEYRVRVAVSDQLALPEAA